MYNNKENLKNKYKNMDLLDLKIGCYLYNKFTNYDKRYLELKDKYKELDLNENQQILDLINWLREWGCRQFKINNETTSITNIKGWYKKYYSEISNIKKDILSYDFEKNKYKIVKIFDELSNKIASVRVRKNEEIDVKIGPVGAAKILFALKPKIFSPWDTQIYKKLKLAGNGEGYLMYLDIIKKTLEKIKKEFESNHDWKDIFEYLDIKHNSYPKLIDEYYWVTITKGCKTEIIKKFSLLKYDVNDKMKELMITN